MFYLLIIHNSFYLCLFITFSIYVLFIILSLCFIPNLVYSYFFIYILFIIPSIHNLFLILFIPALFCTCNIAIPSFSQYFYFIYISNLILFIFYILLCCFLVLFILFKFYSQICIYFL